MLRRLLLISTLSLLPACDIVEPGKSIELQVTGPQYAYGKYAVDGRSFFEMIFGAGVHTGTGYKCQFPLTFNVVGGASGSIVNWLGAAIEFTDPQTGVTLMTRTISGALVETRYTLTAADMQAFVGAQGLYSGEKHQFGMTVFGPRLDYRIKVRFAYLATPANVTQESAWEGECRGE